MDSMVMNDVLCGEARKLGFTHDAPSVNVWDVFALARIFRRQGNFIKH
jgi:hypothetical protein